MSQIARSVGPTNVSAGFQQRKVGILTFHRCINYGSYWQAKGLIEGLRTWGIDACLVDYCDARATASEYRVALRPTLPSPVPAEDVPDYRAKVRQFEHKFTEFPLTPAFELDEPEAMPELDLLIIGSDEVWNLHHPWYAGRRAFFGDGVPTKRVVSYAASFGNHSCWTGVGEPYTSYLRALSAISVRDDNSFWLIKNALGLEAPIVLDPTLQFAFEESVRHSDSADPYVLIYGHNFSDIFVDKVRNWARVRNLPLISLGYRNDWADRSWLSAGPDDFAHAMAAARAVVTNFFHGCAFAIRNDRPFVCEVTPYRNIKVRDLLTQLNGAHRLLGESDGIGDLLDTAPMLEVSGPLRAARESSDAYLKMALEVAYDA